MATYLEYLSFKNCLPWYKRILCPLFLNKEEYKEYNRLRTEPKSDLDEARDYYFFCWNEYLKNPSYINKNSMERAESIVRMYIRKEESEKGFTQDCPYTTDTNRFPLKPIW